MRRPLPGAGISRTLWLTIGGFVFLQAIRDVYFFDVFQTVSLWAIIVVAFGPASIGFLIWSFTRRPDQRALVRHHWRRLLLVNLTTVLGWISYLLALTRVEPAAVSLIHEAISPLVALVAAAAGLTAEAWRPRQFLGATALVSVAGLVAWITLSGRGGYPGGATGDALPFLLLAAASAVLMTMALVMMRQLNEKGLSATSVMGMRFFLLWILAAIMLGEVPEPSSELIVAGLLALPLTLLPILLLQHAIAHSGATAATVGSAFLPPAVWIFQATDSRLTATPWMAAAMALYVIALLWTAYGGRQRS